MRDYDPTLGRYLQADPLGLIDGPSIYGYALQNPGRYTDPTGEFIPQALWCLANPLCRTAAGAAIGVLVGYVLHDDDCYTWRDALIDGGMGAFGAGVGNSLLRNYGSRSLTRQHGFEWSHSIPSKIVKNLPKSWQRQLNQRGGSNGNWVTPVRHYKHDPNRWIKNYESFGPRLPRPVQLLDRVPAWVWATVGGGAIGGASRTNIENRQ